MPHRRLARHLRMPAVLAAAALATITVGPGAGAATRSASPLGGSASVVLEPVPGRAPTPSPQRRRVFTCIEPGLVTFADRPCGPLPELRELVVSRPPAASPGDPLRAAGDPGSSQPVTSAPTARPSGTADSDPGHDRREATCERLELAVRRLDERMRAGYTAREAGQLWSRWREARERVREAGC